MTALAGTEELEEFIAEKIVGDGVFERKSPAPKVFNEDCIILNQKQMMGPSREVVELLQLTSGHLLDG